MSLAPGDLPLETQVVTGNRGRFASKSAKWRIIILTTLAILVGGAWWWRSMPAPPRWVDIREGDSAVLSISTGRDPDGNEIIVAGGYCRPDDTGRDLRVVCYDAANGRVRWEARENQALPQMLIHPNVTIDPAGDVLVGCNIAEVRLGNKMAVWTYSGRDGHELWNWKMENSSEGSFTKAIPSPSRTGGLWVSGIREVSDKYHRFVAALDPKTGVTLWLKDLDQAQDGFDRPAKIHPLRDGGAIMVVPPPSGDYYSRPWLIQHRSNNGELLWEHQTFHLPDLSGGLPILVDETRGQLVLAWMSLPRGVDFHFVALDLATGHERSHVSTHLPFGLEAITPGRDVGIVLWALDETKTVHTKWWRWKMDRGIPRPLQKTEWITRPLQITLLPADGSVVKRERFTRQDERALAWLSKPGDESVTKVMLREKVNQPESSTRFSWRAVEIESKSLFGYFARQPGGNASSTSFPEHAVLTPSGRLVTAGDPAEKKFQWQIRVW